MAHFSSTAAAFGFLLLSTVSAQNVGTQKEEVHPKLTTQTCTKDGGCVDASTAITIDSNWRWTHTTEGTTNCYTGNEWNKEICPDPAACAEACAVDGADYTGTYGITTTDSSVKINFVTKTPYGDNIGSRVYLMADDEKYQMFKLKNQEFTFDVDVSQLGCGLNGAVYFVEMDEDGGMAKHPGNKAGAKYGTGYCDAQCASDIKWINGEANVEDWVPSKTDVNGGNGKYGTCCAEMDIWEANSISTALTPHPCTVTGQTRCEGTDCGRGDDRYNGVCDLDGCDFAPFRTGNTTFYGEGKTVDTKTTMTVVTQFITTDGTADGPLKEIRRLYIQNGKVIENSKVSVPGIPETTDSITDEFCVAAKKAFGDEDSFTAKGGMSGVSDALGRGMVLALSLWADHAAQMLWLDSNYPVDADATKPGVARGTCETSSGVATEVQKAVPDASVTYSNIKIGDIDSTYSTTA